MQALEGKCQIILNLLSGLRYNRRLKVNLHMFILIISYQNQVYTLILYPFYFNYDVLSLSKTVQKLMTTSQR